MKNRTLTPISFPHGWLDILKWAIFFIALASAAHAYGQKPDAQKVEESLQSVRKWQLKQQVPVEQSADIRLLAHFGVQFQFVAVRCRSKLKASLNPKEDRGAFDHDNLLLCNPESNGQVNLPRFDAGGAPQSHVDA